MFNINWNANFNHIFEFGTRGKSFQQSTDNDSEDRPLAPPSRSIFSR